MTYRNETETLREELRRTSAYRPIPTIDAARESEPPPAGAPVLPTTPTTPTTPSDWMPSVALLFAGFALALFAACVCVVHAREVGCAEQQQGGAR